MEHKHKYMKLNTKSQMFPDSKLYGYKLFCTCGQTAILNVQDNDQLANELLESLNSEAKVGD